MKAFFRFLRGELNGFYLTRLNDVNNKATSYIKDFLAYFKKMQFVTEEEASEGEVAISKSMMEGIGAIAGVFSLYMLQDSIASAVKFTDSHIVNGKEYSERGLFDMTEESYEFFRTDEQEYSTDINTLSSSTEKSALVDPDREPLGYFPEGEDVFDNYGNVDLSKLLSAPREGHADSPFYGENFLFLAESYPVLAVTNKQTMQKVIEALQWVRYNGENIASLAKFVNILCDGFVFIVNINWDETYAHGVVEYGLDDSYEVEGKLLKVNIFKFISEIKFPQLAFNEVTINITRNGDEKIITVVR